MSTASLVFLCWDLHMLLLQLVAPVQGYFRKTQQAQGHKADDVWYSPFALVKAKQTYHLQRIMFIYYVLAETMTTRHPNLPAVTEFCCCCCLSVCTTSEFSWIQLQPCLGDQLMPWWDFLQNNLSPIRYKVPQMSFSCLLRWSRRTCPYIRCPHSKVFPFSSLLAAKPPAVFYFFHQPQQPALEIKARYV